jgi:glycosyltransferase involved in cell wall biosynthesis
LSRIALLLPNLAAGGAERVALGLAKFLASRQHMVQVVVAQREGELAQEIPAEVQVVDLEAGKGIFGNPGLAISTSIRLFRWLRFDPPDAIVSSITGMNLVTILACRSASFEGRLVITEHTTLRNFRNPLRKTAMRLLYPKADWVVAVSRNIEAELIGQIGVAPKKVRHIPNGIDRSLLVERAKAPVDHPWLVEPRPPVVVAVGRLSPAKDYPTLIRAFSLVRKELNAKLLIIGEGPERENLERLVHGLDLKDSIALVGFDLNPWRWISRADLYVMSSAWEGCPLALLEALALGLNCVVTAYDDSVLENREKYDLSVVPVGDSIALGRAIANKLSPATIRKAAPKILDPTEAFELYDNLIG